MKLSGKGTEQARAKTALVRLLDQWATFFHPALGRIAIIALDSGERQLCHCEVQKPPVRTFQRSCRQLGWTPRN